MAAEDQEKTEEATGKKIEDARKEGNVPKSQDAAAVVTLIVAFIVVLFTIGYVSERIANLYRYYQSYIGTPFDPKTLHAIAIKTIIEIVLMLLPIVISVMIAGIVGNLMQFGFIFTTKPITPNLNKINPIKGLANLFSLRKLVEAVKIVLKVSIVFGIALVFLLGFMKELPRVELFGLGAQLAWFKEKAIIIGAVVIIAFIIIGVIDIFITRFQYFKSLRMSKQEVRDEFKQMEGDPQIRARIRRLQMETSRRRMVQDVAAADVVITNPTHYAVALRYDVQKDGVPRVMAKGVDFLALQIKEVAYANQVAVYEHPSLARELYAKCDVGQLIPRELFAAVAEVLRFVYRSNRKKYGDRLNDRR